MDEILVELFRGVWDLFLLPWPGFTFSIGGAFLAVLLSATFLGLVLKLCGAHLPSISPFFRSANSRNISISDDRRNDKK